MYFCYYASQFRHGQQYLYLLHILSGFYKRSPNSQEQLKSTRKIDIRWAQKDKQMSSYLLMNAIGIWIVQRFSCDVLENVT